MIYVSDAESLSPPNIRLSKRAFRDASLFGLSSTLPRLVNAGIDRLRSYHEPPQESRNQGQGDDCRADPLPMIHQEATFLLLGAT